MEEMTAHMFELDGILPKGTRLVLDSHAHVALLLYMNADTPVLILRAVSLTPSAAALLLVLLQAYPDYCPYRTLFAALYPMEEWNHKLAIRPIRRAVMVLSQALRHLGIVVIGLRRRGYVLVATNEISIESLIRLRASQWIAAKLTEE